VPGQGQAEQNAGPAIAAATVALIRDFLFMGSGGCC
jgi:hypothetical protein